MGWWGEVSVPFPELEFLRKWVIHHWFLTGRLRVAWLGRGLLLFEFEFLCEAKQVLARGKRRIKENFLHLVKWNLEVGCFLRVSNGPGRAWPPGPEE